MVEMVGGGVVWFGAEPEFVELPAFSNFKQFSHQISSNAAATIIRPHAKLVAVQPMLAVRFKLFSGKRDADWFLFVISN